jgi:small subunit ribosomal protein S20
MPIIQSAKKKVRIDKKRSTVNLRIRRRYKEVVKKAKENLTPENLSKAYSELDMAAKKHVIHKKRASRLKSRLSKKHKKS